MDIHKEGGILIKDKKLLVERSKGKEFFIAPEGSIEEGEAPKQALVRELLEEFRIKVDEDNLKDFGTFYARAAGNESKQVTMDVFLVDSWEGDPEPDNEVEEIAWITSNIPSNKVGSIFEHEVVLNSNSST
jgi:8-oxo-dGTP diphosphatase